MSKFIIRKKKYCIGFWEKVLYLLFGKKTVSSEEGSIYYSDYPGEVTFYTFRGVVYVHKVVTEENPCYKK